MTKAKQTDRYKSPTERASFTINCAPLMVADETITAVLVDELAQVYADGSAVADGDKLSIDAAAANEVAICEPGLERIGPGRGIVGLISGGTAGGKYELTIPFTTTHQPRREAVILLDVR